MDTKRKKLIDLEKWLENRGWRGNKIARAYESLDAAIEALRRETEREVNDILGGWLDEAEYDADQFMGKEAKDAARDAAKIKAARALLIVP